MLIKRVLYILYMLMLVSIRDIYLNFFVYGDSWGLDIDWEYNVYFSI